jgi:4-hydroxy-tetrahydrodipicolinate reductase
MAREVAFAAIDSRDLALSALVSRRRPDWLVDTPHLESLDRLTALPDMLIDFTLAGGTYDAAHWCRASLVPLVSGTTGLSARDRTALLEASELVPVMWAPNLSKGLNLVMRAVIEAAVSLPGSTPVEIHDIHHAQKKDAPSGTALLLAQAIASARQQALEDCLRVEADHDDMTAADGSIGIFSRREGETTGEHRVRFLAAGEEVVFTHESHDRAIYATGALEAGLWLMRQPAGLYTSSDWLAA